MPQSSSGVWRVRWPVARPCTDRAWRASKAVVHELGQLEAAALQWRTCVDSAAVFGRGLPAERYAEIKLERLDEDTVTDMLRQHGLPVAVEVVERFRSIYQPQMGRRRSVLSEDERAVVAPYVVATNGLLGYPQASEAEPGPGEA